MATFKVPPGTEPTEALVTKLVEKFEALCLPRFRKLEQYYRVQNKIRSRSLSAEKPNNKLAHGFAKYITNMATGYFLGKGIRDEVTDTGYKAELDAALDQTATNDTDFEIAKEMSKAGIAFEYLYHNEQADVRYKWLKAVDVIPVYSYAVSEFLEFAVRIWTEEDIVTGKTISFAEAITREEIITYRKDRKVYKEVVEGRIKHEFDDVPLIVYWNNEEQKGDYEDVLDLIDAYDKTQSDTANDMEYFTDAYLVLIGAGGGIVKADGESGELDGDALKTLKQERVLLLDEQGQAQWLIKQINDTAVENFKERLYNDIFFLSQVPALTDESFAGNLTGVAIKYKLIGLEQLASIKQNKFLPARRKKIRLITAQINKRRSTTYDASLVKTKFDRNAMDNLAELAEIVATLMPLASKETLLALLPFIEDAAKERLKKLAEQKQEDALGTIEEDDIERLGGGQ
ncbi:phage portal protein [Mycobacterium gordonae]|nr:phage portal protein [Mycobacterium gordonae]